MTEFLSIALMTLIIIAGSGLQLWLRLRAGRAMLHSVLSAIALMLAGIATAVVVILTRQHNIVWGMITGVCAWVLCQILVELIAPDDHETWWFSDRTYRDRT